MARIVRYQCVDTEFMHQTSYLMNCLDKQDKAC